MRTVARARYVRVPARKARLVLDQIRGKPVGEALATLEYTPRAAARLVAKVLRSAVANAEHNHQVRSVDDLRVVYATADGGPSLKRVQPRAMGRAFFIRHRTSHLTIAVSDETGASMAPVGRAPRPGVRRRRRPGSVSGPAGAPPAAGAAATGAGRPRAGAPARSGRRPASRRPKKETT